MTDFPKLSPEELTVHTIRTLSMDAVQKANSGHPGAPMGLAPLAYVLWKRILRFNPRNPHWLNRDRFVLSNGHASMLLYSMLHLTGYDVSLEDLKNFRQWESITPGHPEYRMTPGVETTTGPLGQGFMNGVGLAIAEAHLAAVYNRDNYNIIDHYTYGFCGDGDLMEGGSHEAASLAGHLALGKLIYVYDDNHITIEGATDISYSDDVAKRFEAYHWHVQNLGDQANNLDILTKAFETARQKTDRPSLIIVRSHIGYGSPHFQDTPEAHGSPLGDEEIRLTKKFYGWPEDKNFLVPEQVINHMQECVQQGEKWEQTWQQKFNEYKKSYPELSRQLQHAISGKLNDNWDEDIPVFKTSEGSVATRSAAGKVLNSFAGRIPWLVGGSADLAPSTKTLINGTGYFLKGKYHNRNIAWGIREFGMCAAASGLALHGGIRPFVSTFFVFTDYARPAIRLASLMEIPVIYVMTHDSIGLGEDGPTHQPVEHLASLRTIPHLHVIRPADANETAYAWRAAMLRLNGPTMLVLSRQNLPILDQEKYGNAAGLMRGAYILSREQGNSAQALLLSSGSEVHIALEAQQKLADKGIDARVVSMPCWELFREQTKEYQEEVLPSQVTVRVAIEAAASQGWCEWIGGQGIVLGIDRFGASAPYQEIYRNYGLTSENMVAAVKKIIDE
jgi:transketolase